MNQLAQSEQLHEGASRRKISPGEIALAVALLVGCISFTAVFTGIDFLSTMKVASCGLNDCNIGLAQAALLIMPILGAVFTVLGAIGSIVLGLLRMRIWVPPAIGLVLIVGTFITVTVTINTSL